MASYKLRETIVAKGYENELAVPFKGKSLQKTFPKDTIVNGTLKNVAGQNIVLTDENPAKNTIDTDTKLPYTGKAQFALDPTKLESVLTPTDNKFLKPTFFQSVSKKPIMLTVPLIPIGIGYFAHHKYGYSPIKSGIIGLLGLAGIYCAAVIVSGKSIGPS